MSVKGPCQPPNHSVATMADTTVTSPYSATKNNPQRMPEYSARKPATSSDSASGRSNGLRFVSARPAMKYVTKASGRTRNWICQPGCAATMCVSESDPTTSTTVTRERICGTSYEMSCPAERRPPMSEYLLFDAQPAMTMPRTVIDPSVVRYRSPMLRSAPTTPGANGSTTYEASIGLKTIAGAARKNQRSVSRARMSSLPISLM